MVDIQFDQEKHEYRENKKIIPSVSQIVRDICGDNYGHVPADVLKAAATYGNHFHKAVHLYDIGKLKESSLDDGLKPDFNAWVEFKNQFRIEVLFSEMIVYSHKHGYCGRLDKVIKFGAGKHKDRVAILDFKTTSSLSPSAHMQADGYFQAFNDGYAQTPHRPQAHLKCIFHVLGDGRFKFIESDPCHNGIFISAVNVYKWKRLNKIKEQ